MDANGESKPNSAKKMSREQVLSRMEEYVETVREYPDHCDIYKEALWVMENFMPVYPEEAAAHLGTLDRLHRGAVDSIGAHHASTCPLAGPDDFPAGFYT